MSAIKNYTGNNFWVNVSGTVSTSPVGALSTSLVYPVPPPSGAVALGSLLTEFSGAPHLHLPSGSITGDRFIYEIQANNQSGSALYFQVFATGALPVSASVPEQVFQVSANSVLSISYRTGKHYPNGISFAWSSDYSGLQTGVYRQVQIKLFYN